MAMNPLAIANLMGQAAQDKAQAGPKKPKSGKQIAAIKAKGKGASKPPAGPGPQGI